MSPLLRVPALIALLWLLAACGGDEPSRPRSALLITLDTTRADALTSYGAPDGVTPHLDRLAREGVLYEEARTTAPLTMPTHASMMTGLYPLRHTVRANSTEALPQSAMTLAEAASEAGLTTGAFVSAVVLDPEFGLDQGFATYDAPTRAEIMRGTHYDRRPAEEIAAGAVAWIEALGDDEPFFLWVHFFDPHLPYDPPRELVERVGGDPYHAEVARMDRAIGDVLAALELRGSLDETLVIAVADHGEAMEEHGEGTHGCLVYDGVIRVPMIVRDPSGHRAGERSDEIASVTDVYPTIAEALGLSAARDVDGMSLFRRRLPADRGVYFESYYGFFGFGWSHIAGWADRRGKTIQSSGVEHYDVRADRAEARDLSAERADVVADHRRALARLAEESVLLRTVNDRATQAVADQLQALGYAGLGSGDEDPLHPLAESDLPNPRDMIGDHRLFLRANDLHQNGRSQEAIELLLGVVSRNDRHHLAWCQVATCYVGLRRYEEAIEPALKSLAVGARWYGPHENLGLAYDNLKRYPEAVEQYKQVLEYKPGHAEIRARLVLLLRYLERHAEAERYAESAPDSGPPR